MLRGEALISIAYPNMKPLRLQKNHLRKLNRSSFSSLSPHKLSEVTFQVSIPRGRKHRALRPSARYLPSRNTCNAPVIKRLLRTTHGLICEPNWEVRTILAPNDTQNGLVYSASASSPARLHLPEAWELTTGSSNVYIGVIDTGIDYAHLDLASNIWTNPGEIPSNGIDDDGNGHIDDIHGIDAYNNDSDPIDDHGHGTYVSGIMGAVGNNARGLAGVAWEVTLIGCKSFNSSGVGSGGAIISCLNYLVNLKNNFGINIVATNNSYGGFPFSQAMYNAIEATRSANIVFVAGAGNNSSNNDTTPFYPANYSLDNIISVGAVNSDAEKPGFSNFGSTVDISAPGFGVYTTVPNNLYGYVQGTSMSTPHVSGAVALLMTYHSDYHYSQVVSAILNTGTVIPALAGQNMTSSILNVEAALAYEAPAPTPTPNPTATPGDSGSISLSISSKSTTTKSRVTCLLQSITNNSPSPLSGYKIVLATKGMKAPRGERSGDNGKASFVIRPPRGGSSVRCTTKIALNGQQTTVRSRAKIIRLKAR